MRHRSIHYILDEAGNPQPEPDLLKWPDWMETPGNRMIERTETPNGTVSTVFLGIDHSFRDDGPPILFETLIFGGTQDGEMWRYVTREEAIAGHKAAVNGVLSDNPE